MYTQCPECQIAFRVTAQLLQQAGGNVRCGSCGHAFNALEYLSEDMPDQDAPDPSADNAEEPVDELAETSRRLLETLDELAGPEEVRIEDTGVEWRVLDEAAAADVGLHPEQIGAEEERRYDDNTPLPDEFDDDEHFSTPEAPQRRQDDQKTEPDEIEKRQGDLALSEPEDWADILAEVRDPSAESLEVEEELAAIHNELSAIDEALTDEVPQLDESELATRADDSPDAVEADLIEQIEAGAAAELSATNEGDETDDSREDLEDDEDTGLFESVLAEDEDGEHDEDFQDSQSVDDKDEGDDEDEIEDVDVDDVEGPAGDLDFGRESTGEFDAQIDAAARALADGEEGDEYDEIADGELLDGSPGELDDTGQDEFAEDDDVGQEKDVENDDEIIVDSQDEEELDASAEKSDFAASVVAMENPEDLFDESSGEVETIIMEGEFIRSDVEKDRLAAEHAARSELDDPAKLFDTYALNRGKVRGGRRNYDPPSTIVIGAIVGLGLILAGQFLHNSRQSLATYGLFNSTIAPVYRMLGSPITPDWDINGWQFEATNGSVDEDETTLTIVSRIANRSAQLLPYPLIHVELTDRFDDVTGGAILEPAEYLAIDGDPSRPIEPDENFTAVITVDDPSVDVSGYRLKVCYRVEPGTVRCAEEAFRN